MGKYWKHIFKLVFSALLIYFAFLKVDTSALIKDLIKIPLWLVIWNIVYAFGTFLLINYRWSSVLLKKPTFRDVLFFTKCTYMGSFYGLFFPSLVAVDMVKWLPLMKRYKDMGKLKIAGSVLIDRVIGASSFFPVALAAAIMAKFLKYDFPNYLFYVFGIGSVAVFAFYLMIYFFNFEKYFGRIKYVNKLIRVMDLLKNENKRLLVKLFLYSILIQFLGVLPVWFNARFLGVPFPIVAVYVFMPIISLILLLPISVAGFGAREQLFLFFFSQLGIGPEKILLVSTFSGIITVISSLLGGLTTLF
jgi:hypothetical protein